MQQKAPRQPGFGVRTSLVTQRNRSSSRESSVSQLWRSVTGRASLAPIRSNSRTPQLPSPSEISVDHLTASPPTTMVIPLLPLRRRILRRTSHFTPHQSPPPCLRRTNSFAVPVGITIVQQPHRETTPQCHYIIFRSHHTTLLRHNNASVTHCQSVKTIRWRGSTTC
jgi:hypothetical protein